MKKCEKCGKKVENEARFCPVCGNYFENPRKPQRSQYEPADIQNNKIMAALAYMGILVLIPIFAAKESRFARYHVRQGLVLFISGIAFSVCYLILSFVALSVSWKLFPIVRIVGLLSYAFLVLSVIGISNAVSGKVKRLPVIGSLF